jgi:N4-bis(aminopropyl)spermidine synthase
VFYRDLQAYISNSAEEYDVLARITQHPSRPRPNREIDQIFMLPGSQLNQAKLVSDYVRGREDVFVGDGDCMALTLGILAQQRIIDGPAFMRVLDFDHRLVQFVNEASRQFGFHEKLEAHHYNVRFPIQEHWRHRSDVFYTNPPYGSKNQGFSGEAFLGRCMELCKPVGSWGIAVLPYHHHEQWSREAMFNIQGFVHDHGYLVSEMLLQMHSYHLDDNPRLLSGTVVMDRVQETPEPFKGRELTADELSFFYGSRNIKFPDGVDTQGALYYDSEASQSTTTA